MTKDEIRALLPKVGERLMLPSMLEAYVGQERTHRLRPCVVEYVNEEHFWYQVRFDTGRIESYKLPDVRLSTRGRWAH